MKRILSLILAITLIAAMAIPAAAISNVENANQCAEILSASEGVEETVVAKVFHLEEKKMMEIYNAAVEAEDEVVPKDADVKHLTMIRQKDVVCKETPIEYSVKINSVIDRYICVFFKGLEDEEWSIVACEYCRNIDFSLPGSGQYAIAWSW